MPDSSVVETELGYGQTEYGLRSKQTIQDVTAPNQTETSYRGLPSPLPKQ